MASTGVIDGSIIVFKNGGNTVAYGTNFEISESVATRNITTKDTSNGVSEYAAQRIDSTISIEGLVAYDATEGYEELRSDLVGLASVSATWGTFVTGDPEYSASVIVTSLSKSAPLDDNATYSAEFQITGAVTVGTTT